MNIYYIKPIIFSCICSKVMWKLFNCWISVFYHRFLIKQHTILHEKEQSEKRGRVDLLIYII